MLHNFFWRVPPFHHFSTLFPRGVVGRPLAHFGSLLAPFWFVFGSMLVVLGIIFTSILKLLTIKILTFVTPVCKVPAEQPHTPSSKELHLTRATCGTLPQVLQYPLLARRRPGRVTITPRFLYLSVFLLLVYLLSLTL